MKKKHENSGHLSKLFNFRYFLIRSQSKQIFSLLILGGFKKHDRGSEKHLKLI